jgi:hypothetical protein
MACPEFANVHEVAKRLGVSVSFLTKRRLYDPAKSPPFICFGRRVIYPLTGPNSLETWTAAQLQKSPGAA